MKPLQFVRRHLMRGLVNYLVGPAAAAPAQTATCHGARLAACLQTGDIVLVHGRTRFASAVCALTGSRWSHVAICVRGDGDGDAGVRVVEADVAFGVREASLDEFDGHELLVMRPVGLSAQARGSLAAYLLGRIGQGYDIDHILGLCRLLIARRLGPVPAAVGRQAGRDGLPVADPARAICSTLVAHALAAAGVRLQIDAPVATAGRLLSLDHLVPGDFERATGMATVFDSRQG